MSTRDRAIRYGNLVPLKDVVVANQAVAELYGTTEWIVNETKVRKVMHQASTPFTEEDIDYAVYLIEERVDRVNGVG